jgi:hypothetical protein
MQNNLFLFLRLPRVAVWLRLVVLVALQIRLLNPSRLTPIIGPYTKASPKHTFTKTAEKPKKTEKQRTLYNHASQKHRSPFFAAAHAHNRVFAALDLML